MNQRGSVLMGVLLIIGFSLLVGVPVLQAAQVENKAAINDQMDAQAFYLAEAGIQHVKVEALKELQRLAAEGWQPADGIPSPFATVSRDNYGPGDYDASAYLLDNGDGTFGIRLESDGIVGGTTGLAKGTRITFPLITDDSGGGGGGPGGGGGSGGTQVIDSAVFVKDRLTMANTASIGGDVRTNATASQSIVFSNSIRINGDLFVGKGGNPNTVINWSNAGRKAVTGDVAVMDKNLEYQPVVLPESPNLPNQGSINLWHSDYTIESDKRFGAVGIGSNSELTIVAPAGSTRVVRMSRLDISNGGKLTVVGGGNVSLFVDGDITLSNNHTSVQETEGSKLTVYQRGNGFYLSNGSVFKGTLVAESTVVTISNGSDMSGNIFTGGNAVYISNSGNLAISLVYAPNGHVALSNQAKIVGAIVARTCDMSNSSQVNYDGSVRNLLGGGGSPSIDFGDSIWAPTR